jgi:diguanylate cyclase (GGDEF)-like protein
MKKKTIAFITESAFDRFQSQLLAGAEKAAEECDASLIRLSVESIINTNRLANQIEIITDSLRDYDPDGLMFLGWTSDIVAREKFFLDRIRSCYSFPLVSLGRPIEGIHSISMDGKINIRDMLAHLVDVHSYKKIVFIEPFTPDERLQAYIEFMGERGLLDESLIIRNDDLREDLDWLFKKRVRKIMQILSDRDLPHVDAIMSMYTYESFFILENLKEQGISVPDDIAITSWEDGERGRYATPSITSVYYPFFEQGHEGVMVLNRLMHGMEAPRHTLVPGKLMIRRSCGCMSLKIDRSTLHISSRANSSSATADPEEGISRINIKTQILDSAIMVESFLLDVKNKSERKFLRYVEKRVQSVNTDTELIYTIQEDIFAFRAAVTPYLADNPELQTMACNLWVQSQIVMEENIEIAVGFNEVLERGNEFIIHEIGHDIVTTLDIPQLLDIFENGLWKMGIKNCLMGLRGGDIEHSSEVYPTYYYHNGTRIDIAPSVSETPIGAVLREILSDGSRHVLLSFLMHINRELIGRVIFECDTADERVYNLLATQLASAIYSARILDDFKKTNRNLRDAQSEIIKNMAIISEKTTALEESNEKLAQLDQLKNDFIANITHDFRSPLMVILNTADLAQKYDRDYSPETVTKRYELILQASIKLKDTIDRLLDLAKMDTMGVRLNISGINLSGYLESVIDFFRSAVASTSIVIDGVFPPYEIEGFHTDVDKLEEILHNILSNAVKFVDPKKGKITVTLIDNTEMICIIISDNGIGIPRDKLGVIFERFEQVNHDTRGMCKGSGIGLAFAQQLVEYLGGSIRAESDGPGLGAQFYIEFPKGNNLAVSVKTEDKNVPEINRLKREHTKELVAANITEQLNGFGSEYFITDPNPDGEFDPKKAIIAIIDDNRYICDILREYLSRAGYLNFVVAHDGKSGLDAIYRTHPDCVICDYNIPIIRGDKLHDRMNDSPDLREIPLVFMTAVTDREVMRERKLKGAFAYLEKPVNEEEFLITVEMAIKRYMKQKILLQNAHIDSLTGLSTRPVIMNFLSDWIMTREYRKLCLVIFDIDGFGEHNERYGHHAGDVLLSQTGRLVRETLRRCDRAGRLIGDRFLVVLPDTEMKDALIVAEKIRARIEREIVAVGGHTFSATASFGVSSLFEGADYIANALGIRDLHSIFDIADAKNADWARIDRMKQRTTECLMEMAESAHRMAKGTPNGNPIVPFQIS